MQSKSRIPHYYYSSPKFDDCPVVVSTATAFDWSSHRRFTFQLLAGSICGHFSITQGIIGIFYVLCCLCTTNPILLPVLRFSVRPVPFALFDVLLIA